MAGLQSAGVSFRREKGQPQFWRKHGPYPCGIHGGGRSLVPHVCMWAAGRLRDIQPGQSEPWEGTGRGAAVSTGEGPYLPTFPTAELRRQMSEGTRQRKQPNYSPFAHTRDSALASQLNIRAFLYRTGRRCMYANTGNGGRH